MKYAVLLFDDPAAWQNVSETELTTLRQAYMAVTEEPESYGGAQLQPAETAKTLRMKDGESIVTDAWAARSRFARSWSAEPCNTCC